MTDKNNEQSEFVNVRVTPESMDAHVQCLKDNGYNIKTTFSLITRYAMAFLLGAYCVGIFNVQ